MNRILAIIVLCLVLVTSMSSQALSFDANTTNSSIAVGDIVVVDVSTSNFTGIEYFQYTIEWDPSNVELISVTDCSTDIDLNCTLGTSNFNESTPGVMRVSWFDPTTLGVTIPDNAKVFSIRLRALADGDMGLKFSDAGVVREAEGDNGYVEGAELVTSFSGTTTVGMNGGGNNGGGSAGDLSFSIGDLTGEVGSEVCVPVTVENFTDVIFYQYTMEWNASVLDLVRLQNCNSDIALNCTLGTGQTHFNETNTGVLRHNWLDQATVGKSLADDAVLFEMCFDLLAAGNSNVAITGNELSIEAETAGAGEIDANDIVIDNGTAQVTNPDNGGGNSGGGSTGDLGFSIGDLSGEVGSEVCVPVTVSNFTDVIFYQYTMEWNASVLDLVRLQNCNNDIALNCTLGTGQTHFNETNTGVLRHNWLDQATVGKSLADDAVLFEMCFDLLAAGNSNVAITGNELSIEAETAGAGEIDANDILINNGTATVTDPNNGGGNNGGGNSGGGSTDDLGFSIGDLTGDIGSEVCVPVTVSNFTDVIFYQYTMEWDASILDLVRLQNCNTDIALNCTLGTGQTHFNETNTGVLRHNWLDQATVGKSLADDAVIFEMCFDLLAAGTGDVSITGRELSIEAETAAAGEIDANNIAVNNGTATVTDPNNGGGNNGGGSTDDLSFTIGDLTGDIGTEVCVPVTVANFDDVIFYQYTMEWDASVLDLTRLNNCNTDIALNCTLGTGQTHFNETNTGVLRHNWLDQSTVGKSLADNAILFEMCFDLLAAGSSDISITGRELGIEAETKGAGEIDANNITINNGTATVTDSNGGGGNSGGGNSGGGEPSGPIRFSTTSANVAAGGSTCLNIMVDNFIDITSFSFSQTWDASKFELEGIMMCNSALTGLDCGLGNANFALVGNNRVDISWTDPSASGTTIPTGELLFQICLKAIGSPGEGTNVAYGTNISVNNKDGALLPEDIQTQDAQISINGTAVNGQLSFFAQEITGSVGDKVCLEVTTDNFENIVFFQYTMEWDDSVLSLSNLEDCNTDLGLNCDIANNPTNFNQTSSSSMRASWTDAASVGKTLTDGSILYEICFDIVGAMGTSSLVQFTSSEIAIEAQDDSGVLETTDIVVQNGMVQVNGNGGGSSTAPLGFSISKEAGRQSDTVCVAITAENFNDIVHFQYNIEWNSAVLQFIGVDACNSNLEGLNCVEGNTSTNFNLTTPGLLRTSWLHPPTTGLSIADDETLFNVCFKLVGNSGASSGVQITDSQLDIEAGNPDGDIAAADITLTSGQVDIVTVMPVPTIDRILATDLLCNASNTGAIDIDISGGVAPLTYIWSNGATTQDLNNLARGTYRVSVTDGEGRVIVSDPVRIFEPAPIAIGNVQVIGFNSVDNVDGAIDIAVSGGTTPYSFVWNNGATTEDLSGLNPGCYSVVITDRNGCEINSGDICVEDELGPLSAVNATPIGVFCSADDDGSITVSFSGGEAPFMIALSSGEQLTSMTRRVTFDNLTVGNYNVDVTDALNNTVSGSASVGFTSTLTAATSIESDYNGFAISAFGRNDATISAAVDGSDGSETYQWSDNLGSSATVNNVGAGTYTVTVTDGTGCTTTSDVTVIEPQLLRATATADLAPGCKTICEGEASANVEGGVSPYSFAWNTGGEDGVLFDLCAGSYSVTVTDANNVTSVSEVTIVEPDSLKLTFETTSPSSLNGSDGSATVIVSGGTAPFTYQWNDNNGTRTAENTGLSADTYFVIVTDANGCQVIGMVEVTMRTASCYDSRDIITIDGDGKNDNFMIECADNVQNTLQIFNRWGQLVFDATNYDNTWEGTDKRGNKLPSGGYFWVLRVNEDNGDISVYKDHLTIITED